MPAVSHKTIERHKTTNSLLTTSTIDKSQSRAIRKNQSSGDIMRTANQMAKDKKNNIETTSTGNKNRVLVKSNTSKTFTTENTPIKSKKKIIDKSNDTTMNDKETGKGIEKDKESEKDIIKKPIASSSKKTHIRKTKKKGNDQNQTKLIEKKSKKSDEEQSTNEIEKKKEVTPTTLDEVIQKIEFKEKGKENSELSKEAINNEDKVIETQSNKNQLKEDQLSNFNTKHEQLQSLLVNWGSLSKFFTHEEQYVFGSLNKTWMKSFLFSTKTELQIELTKLETALNEICQVSNCIVLISFL